MSSPQPSAKAPDSAPKSQTGQMRRGTYGDAAHAPGRETDQTSRLAGLQRKSHASLATQRLAALQRKADAGFASKGLHGAAHTAQGTGAGPGEVLQAKDPARERSGDDAGVQAPRAGASPGTSGGLPQDLRAGIEHIGGVSLDDVKVHRNSGAPAQLGALAYAQGRDIHLGPGQEKHLPHEAWHVVQQAQGRVKPTLQAGGMAINDDPGLEREADAMGAQAVQKVPDHNAVAGSSPGASNVVQRAKTHVQGPVDPSFPSPLPAGDRARPSVQFRTLFRVDPGQGVIQRLITLKTPPAGLPEELEVLQVLEHLHPWIKTDTLSRETRGYIVQLLDEYDEDDRSFDDLAELAVTLQADVREEEPETRGILEQNAEIFIDPMFGKMFAGLDLPELKQKALVDDIALQAALMAANYRHLHDVVKSRSEAPELTLKRFTHQTRGFALAILKAAKKAFGLPPAPLTVLIAGSGARGEMFPGSDLDLAPVTTTERQEDVVDIFEFMQKVEKILQLTVKAISRSLQEGPAEEVGLGPDTGVFPFKMTPELLAEGALGMQNTGQDAEVLAESSGAKEAHLGDRFLDARNKIATEPYGLVKLGEILREFAPPEPPSGIMNIKTQFLRMPTLALRDLAQVCGLRATNSFDRVRELVQKKYLDASTGRMMIEALNLISGVRLQCHVHYGVEKDTFAAKDSDRTSDDDYVLTKEEHGGLVYASGVLADFHSRLATYQQKRVEKKWGMLTGNTI